MAQQLPWAFLFFAIGGMPWVVWGIAVRVSLPVTGHWLVGYFAHNRGRRSWHIERAGVQGYNVPYCGLIAVGEGWHNNHHAFPGSAQLGVRPRELDPGWWVLMLLALLGLAWNIKTPNMLHFRPNLVPL
jgi:fatty-acid desaturase